MALFWKRLNLFINVKISFHKFGIRCSVMLGEITNSILLFMFYYIIN